MLLIGSVSSALAQQRSPRPNDPYVADQWNLKAVGAFSAWSNTRGRGAKIAIVDSGVDLRHPDLRKNIVSSGADFIDPDGRDAAQDEHGHGTHVAGIAAAIANNGIGVAGVAPKSRILPVRVLDETNSGSTSGVADGVRYAANKGADVINLSLSSQPGAGEVLSVLDDPVGEAIDYAWEQGAVVVVAAGNTPGWPLCQEPASSAVAVCVGGVDPELNSLFWSRDATLTTTHLVAPAGDPFQVGPDRGDCTRGITSTWLRRAQRGNPCSPADDGYERASGTSMAAPVVSGVAALLSSQGLDNEAIVERLISTAQDLGASGRDPVFGYGLVDAAAAVSAPN
jgi:subtilisin family serine protease